MDTLKRVRPDEHIKMLKGAVMNIQDTAYLTVELQGRGKSILVVCNHSDTIVDEVIKKVNPEDSGYLFFASELDIDPLNNGMVPVHRIATAGEIEIITKRGVPKSKLPVLPMLDPIRRWHNFSPGSIVAIERSGGLYFRVVL